MGYTLNLRVKLAGLRGVDENTVVVQRIVDPYELTVSVARLLPELLAVCCVPRVPRLSGTNQLEL